MVKSKKKEKLSLDEILSLIDKVSKIAPKIGVAYMGYKAFKHWTGALAALIALDNMKSQNVVVGTASISTLATLGLVSLGVVPTRMTESEKEKARELGYIPAWPGGPPAPI